MNTFTDESYCVQELAFPLLFSSKLICSFKLDLANFSVRNALQTVICIQQVRFYRESLQILWEGRNACKILQVLIGYHYSC